MDLQKNLSKTVVSLLNSRPFYGHMLTKCVKEFTDKIPTMAVYVRHQMHLLVNPEFYKSLKEEERKSVLEHEILHLIFRHCIRGKRHSDHNRSNVACDIVCNQCIDGPLPGDPCTYQKFELKEDKDLDWYYKNLPKTTRFVVDAGSGLGSHDIWDDIDQKGKGSSDSIAKGKKKAKLTEETRDSIIKEAIRQSAAACSQRSIGNLPMAVQQEIETALAKKEMQLPWYQILRRFAAHATRSTITYTKKRMSKRYGTRPGVKIGKRLNLLVGIDTSGSISNEELNLFLSEISYIERSGADVTIVECDTQINGIHKFKKNMNITIHGRGGTDMNKVLDFYEERRNDYDCCFLFTDGETPIRKFGPRKPWLWCFVHDYHKPCDWGPQVVLPPTDKVA